MDQMGGGIVGTELRFRHGDGVSGLDPLVPSLLRPAGSTPIVLQSVPHQKHLPSSRLLFSSDLRLFLELWLKTSR